MKERPLKTLARLDRENSPLARRQCRFHDNVSAKCGSQFQDPVVMHSGVGQQHAPLAGVMYVHAEIGERKQFRKDEVSNLIAGGAASISRETAIQVLSVLGHGPSPPAVAADIGNGDHKELAIESGQSAA